MPKSRRSPEEVEAVKAEILSQATQLICEEGFRGFSMRKLGARLNVSAKTIYNYYHNIDEIYLSILTQGFEQLYRECVAARQAHSTPGAQLKAMLKAYLDFGLQNPYLYNLMFTWVVPKYNDYLGTKMEPAARIELETAQKSPALFAEAIMAYLAASADAVPITPEQAQVIVVQIWTQAHGYVAGINNTLLDYMIDDPISLKEIILESLFSQVGRITELGRM
ncbi:MAG: TetR/AcrR family transcriptional regulator [Candidatus Promineifilaceae bacterium]|nr:TetR/AcrR family transcriptional regulator [Candidatus Promineifilaceae bacterium]